MLHSIIKAGRHSGHEDIVLRQLPQQDPKRNSEPKKIAENHFLSFFGFASASAKMIGTSKLYFLPSSSSNEVLSSGIGAFNGGKDGILSDDSLHVPNCLARGA